MDFKLACGHTIVVGPFECWLRVIRETKCIKCVIGVPKP
jgi:hypothetical protein